MTDLGRARSDELAATTSSQAWPLLVADMPYGSFHTGADDTVRAALKLIKEGEAEAGSETG